MCKCKFTYATKLFVNIEVLKRIFLDVKREIATYLLVFDQCEKQLRCGMGKGVCCEFI